MPWDCHDDGQQRRQHGCRRHEGRCHRLPRKPFGAAELIAAVNRALDTDYDGAELAQRRATAALHIAELTPRQQQIMDLVLAGHPSKNIAADLAISQRTVENHWAAIMIKTRTKSLPALGAFGA